MQDRPIAPCRSEELGRLRDVAQPPARRSQAAGLRADWLGVIPPGQQLIEIKGFHGAQGRNRTTDTVIFSHVLYQLSYLG